MIESLDWGRYLISLGVVGAMIVGLAFLTKRVGLAAKMKQSQSLKGHMEVVDTLYLEPRKRVVLVRCKSREHMILISGDQAQYISAIEE